MSLDGKTPAEVAGLDLGLGQNKWVEFFLHTHNPILTTPGLQNLILTARLGFL